MRKDYLTREKLAEGGMPARNKKNFRPTKSGAGMTQAGVMAYRRKNPGSKLKTAARSNQDQKLRRDVSPSAREAPAK
jgi:hypothetical protein